MLAVDVTCWADRLVDTAVLWTEHEKVPNTCVISISVSDTADAYRSVPKLVFPVYTRAHVYTVRKT